MTYPVHLSDSKYILIPAAKSIFLRDIWAIDTDNGTVVSVLCLRCSTYPVIYKSYDPDVYESRCECTSQFVFAADIAKHAQVDLDVVMGFLYPQYFNVTKSPEVQNTFLTWLAVQSGIDIKELDIELS